MDELEKQLTALSRGITAPEDLEQRLTAALESRTRPPRPARKWIAAAVVLLLLFGYSWDALAYYGKKIIGYEQVSTVSLQELVAQGQGQQIEKSGVFSNGVKVTLDGLIMDGKGFATFIKVEYPEGYGDLFQDHPQFELKGIFTYVQGSGTGEQQGNQVHWVRTFDEEPMLLEKRMALKVSMNIDGKQEEVEIPFVLNRSQAYVPTAGKIEIGEKIESPYGTIYFDSFQASALSTVVTGRITGATLLKPGLDGGHVTLDFDVSNGGQSLQRQSSSSSSSNDRDYRFEFKFAGINRLEDIKITGIGFTEARMIDKEITIEPGMAAVELSPEAGEAVLRQVRLTDGNTLVIIEQQPGVQAMLGFFRRDAQLEPNVKQKGTTWEYLVPGEGIRMEVKTIDRTYPVKEVITLD